MTLVTRRISGWWSALFVHMTSPRVVELPRRLEPVSRDTFCDRSTPLRVADVIPLRPRVAPELRRPPAPQPPRAAA